GLGGLVVPPPLAESDDGNRAHDEHHAHGGGRSAATLHRRGGHLRADLLEASLHRHSRYILQSRFRSSRAAQIGGAAPQQWLRQERGALSTIPAAVVGIRKRRRTAPHAPCDTRGATGPSALPSLQTGRNALGSRCPLNRIAGTTGENGSFGHRRYIRSGWLPASKSLHVDESLRDSNRVSERRDHLGRLTPR